MYEKIKKILNRKDEKFTEFLKKYWWIEFLAVVKVLVFVERGYYDFFWFGLLFIIGIFGVLWIWYRVGVE